MSVGSEPTGIALTPTGATAWVTNWVDGTLTAISTATMTVKSTVDLNAPLVQTGYLGTVTARPALAHPRSIAISNNGDKVDSDESMYVTEYFATGDRARVDRRLELQTRAKTGIVYRVKLSDHSVNTITLAPLADMGFKDENAGTAGCFPNQLQAIALNGQFAYVVSVCASPRGPTGPKVTTTTCATAADCSTLNLVDPLCVQPSATSAGPVCVDGASVKTTTAPLISIIDTTAAGGAGAEIAKSATSLNAKFSALFDTKNARRRRLDPSPPALLERHRLRRRLLGRIRLGERGRRRVPAGLRREGRNRRTSVGASTANFIDLNPAGIADPAAAGLRTRSGSRRATRGRRSR